jgi:hypothetical protein
MDSEAIVNAVLGVTKAWSKQRRAEERSASASLRRHEALVRSRCWTIKDAAWRVMEAAYMKASSDNRYPAHARQIMYAARGEVQRISGSSLDDQYFCQRLLPDYLNDNPEQTAKWDVVFDARGHFQEPHTELIVPLGTIDVRRYLGDIQSHEEDGIEAVMEDADAFPTCGPEHRFGAILFCEKEGFLPLFKASLLAERYDLAIMSTKGLSVTASRLLVDRLCSAHGIPLLVLHDFDKSGFSIVGTLQRDTRRYSFVNEIRVADLGLRLRDVEEQKLEAEDVYLGKSDPAPNLRVNGATEEEIKYLCKGRRVELNAFSSGDLISWIEAKLREHGVAKVIPPAEVLEQAYRRALEVRLMRRRLREVGEEVRKAAAEAPLPEGLVEEVREAVKDTPQCSWDSVLAELATDELGDDESEEENP